MFVSQNPVKRWYRYLIELFLSEEIYAYYACKDFRQLLDFLSRYGTMFQLMEIQEKLSAIDDTLADISIGQDRMTDKLK